MSYKYTIFDKHVSCLIRGTCGAKLLMFSPDVFHIKKGVAVLVEG